MTVGFDLDLTLVDSRPGIRAALHAFAAESGRDIDVDAIVANLGPPVADALAPWFTADELPAAVARFREHMAQVGVQNVTALPGAARALERVRAANLRVLVVTAKVDHLAEATLHHAGLAADVVVGDRWQEGKAAALVEHDAIAYVGDHPADMLAARAAGVRAIGVTTGAHDRQSLIDAGADVVIGSLADLPRVLPSRTQM